MANEFDKEKVPTPISMIVSFLLCDLFVHSFDFVIVETASTTDQQFFLSSFCLCISLRVCAVRFFAQWFRWFSLFYATKTTVASINHMTIK